MPESNRTSVNQIGHIKSNGTSLRYLTLKEFRKGLRFTEILELMRQIPPGQGLGWNRMGNMHMIFSQIRDDFEFKK